MHSSAFSSHVRPCQWLLQMHAPAFISQRWARAWVVSAMLLLLQLHGWAQFLPYVWPMQAGKDTMKLFLKGPTVLNAYWSITWSLTADLNIKMQNAISSLIFSLISTSILCDHPDPLHDHKRRDRYSALKSSWIICKIDKMLTYPVF